MNTVAKPVQTREQTAALESAIGELRALLGDRLSTQPQIRAQHGHGEAFYPALPPDAVAFPESTEETAAIVRICAKHRVPIIPFGAGTSLEGHVCAPHGGVCVSTARMDRILESRSEDLLCHVEAGVTRETLNRYLRDEGTFFPMDPGADATLGGMAATRASGTNAVRYGTMRENVIALTVVLPNGEVMRTARRARKSAAGYDLTRLFVGSEGTLGIITEVTVRLYGLPETTAVARCAFPDLRAATDTVIQTIQLGVPIARVELLDTLHVQALNGYSNLDLPESPTLFLEFHGSRASVDEQIATVRAIASDHGTSGYVSETDPERCRRLWKARHDAYHAAKSLRPGRSVWSTDVCVPISRLSDCLAETHRDLAGSRLLAPIVGHVGDGNFHMSMLLDPDDPEDMAEARRLHERLVERALRMDGTCTGEHGVGMGKRGYLLAEHGPVALQAMRSIKAALDPLGIMNPGKVLLD